MNIKEPEHGGLYWFLRNAAGNVASFTWRHWLGTSMTFLAITVTSFLLRAVIHPYVMMVRKRSFLLVLGLILLLVWLLARRRRPLVKVLASLFCVVGLGVLFLWGGPAHDYLALYFRYRSLNVLEMGKLPITGHERLQPRNSVYSLALEKIQETEAPSIPDYVRVGNEEYRWTLGIEPVRIKRVYGNVEEVVSVLPFDPSPNFSTRDRVSFETGEGMFLGRNTLTATIKTFSLWRYLNYEPADVKYVKDDSGEWVQVVSLVRWKGIFFPRPEFGGVQVIRQRKETLSSDLRLVLLGAGERIPPESISKHRFLVGQNNIPYEVSRYIADSFRFQNGFFSPMPWIHQGDIRIPDLPADVNDQPFTTYFEQVAPGLPGMLYHYFALEPYDPDKQGLNVSLFIPADGWGNGSSGVHVYKHFRKGGILTGVSAITAKVMDSRKEYDWSRHGPVEHRPYIRDINGTRRFFWLTTVVTYKESGNGKDAGKGSAAHTTEEFRQGRRFIAGGLPNIVLTDADHNIPVWMSSNPDEWVSELKSNPILSRLWEQLDKR